MSTGGQPTYDAVVIGSGFGGSVATYRLSQAGCRVCLLERGRAYPPGSFVRGAANAKDAFWAPRNGIYGLFNVWSFTRMLAIVSSGLGGGSLIYANVLLRKPPDWFKQTMPGGEPWPITYDDLKPHYKAVEGMLGGKEYPADLRTATPKTRAFIDGVNGAGLPGLQQFWPKLAITFAARGREGARFDAGDGNRFGAERFACRLVGECDVGCNFGAKNSLDLTYLSHLSPRAEVRVLCDVKSVAKRDGRYEVQYADYGNGGRTETVSAPRVIVAAGALGSTYLLLKSRDALGGLSAALGRRFSGNGDLLTFARSVRENGRPRLVDPAFGPVITAAALVPDDRGRDMYLEDGGAPNALWWAGEVLEAPRTLVRFMPRVFRILRKALSNRPERDLGADLSALLAGTRVAAQTLPLLGMGRDLPTGRLKLRNTDQLLDLEWDKGDRLEYYRRAHEVSKAVANALGARFGDLSFRINHYVTVHPLGGCPMSATPGDGVVDPFGRVYGHEGLYVVDGSVMPGPVGANPSLTIAAFADRAAVAMLAAG
jgi:cholesterol oxidase